MSPMPARPNAKVHSLSVRPIQSVDLAFEVPGVLSFQDFSNACLGKRLERFDFENFYSLLENVDHSTGLFLFDGANILKKVRDSMLFTLRNRGVSASLSQSIASRANAYLEKYSSIQRIHKIYQDIYANDADPENNRMNILASLSGAQKARYEMLMREYCTQNRKSVVKDYSARVNITPIASRSTRYSITINDSSHDIDSISTYPQILHTKEENDTTKVWSDLESLQQAALENESNPALRTQKTTTELVELRYPEKDEEIAFHKAHIELQDELLRHSLIKLRVENLSQIMTNELKLMDLEVMKQQEAYIQTIMLSPISGIVTAIYKDVGETVDAGEPVIRIENDDELLIVGLIQYRGGLSLNQEVTFITKKYESNDTITLTGQLVAIRGHDADDDSWDVIIRCRNSPDRNDNRLPINYQFDKDNTDLYILCTSNA